MDTVRSFLNLADDAPTGRGVRVAVIDSGIDAGHSDLEHAVDGQASKDWTIDPRFGIPDLKDYFGHGTRVAGIIAGSGKASGGTYRGIAPNATIIALKVGENAFEAPWLQAAILDAINKKADIITVAAGLSPLKEPLAKGKIESPWVWAPEPPPLPELKRAAAEGILCLVTGGNHGTLGPGTVNGLAGPEEILAVGACDCEGKAWPRSGRGPYRVDTTITANQYPVRRYGGPKDKNAHIELVKPDFVAPGYAIRAPLSRISEHVEKACERSDCFSGAYFPDDGSSLAAAVAAGLAACAIEALKIGPRDLGDNLGRLLRRMLRRAAQLNKQTDAERFGLGILKWDALLSVIDRFHSEDDFYAQLVSPGPD
jgi:subtilisin family serine protease